MPITFPSDTKDTIDAIRNAIGREITFYVVMKEDCPTCTLDPITNTSTDSFCPTCSGYGYIRTTSGYSVTAHITWGHSDVLNWQSAGQMYDGDCRVQVEYIPETVAVLNLKPEYVVVDNKRMSIKKKILRGVPSINRILLDLIEQTDEV